MRCFERIGHQVVTISSSSADVKYVFLAGVSEREMAWIQEDAHITSPCQQSQNPCLEAMCNNRRNEMQLTGQACTFVSPRRNNLGELIWLDCRAPYIADGESSR